VKHDTVVYASEFKLDLIYNWRHVMGELERELRKISKSLNDLARKVNQVATKAVGGTKVAATPRTKLSKKAQGRKSAADVIMALIKARKSGVDTATLRARTGFGSQKVRSIVWELCKKCKIERIHRGVYRKAK
jgi:predicted CopG family antitoxin